MKLTTFSLVLLAGAGSVLANPHPKQNNQTPAFDKREPVVVEKRQTTRTNTNDTPHTSASSVPTGPGPALSPCITKCATDAAQQASCTSFADLSCVCSSDTFKQAALKCLQANCTQTEQQDALALQAQQCGSSSATITGSGTATGTASSGAPTGTPTATATAPGGSSTAITGSATTQGAGSATGSSTTGAPATQTSNAAPALDVVGFGSVGFGKWAVVGLAVTVGGLVVG